MPATMTRRKIRTVIRRKLGEPEGTEKNWTNEELNDDIQAALDEVANFGVLRGSVSVDGDGGADYDIPAEILQLFLVRVGDTDYLPCFVADYAGLSVSERGEIAIVNETEQTVTLPADVDADTDVEFIGALHATQLDAEDEDDDDTVLNLDNRFRSLIERGAIFRAHEATEDNVATFEKAWDKQCARFGMVMELARPVLYRRVTKQINDHCRY